MVEIAGRSQSIARRSAVMSAITVISRLTGYVRIAVMAYALGATAVVSFGGSKVGIGDSYNLSNVIPNIIFDLLVGGVLYSLFVPIVIEKLSAGDEGEVWHVASSMINATALLTLFLSATGFFLAGPITRLMTATRSAEDSALAIWFFRFFTWQIFFYGLCAVFTGILNAYRHFVAPVAAPLANNAIVIATGLTYAALAPRNFPLALVLLAVGTTLGIAAMSLIQIPALIRVGVRYKPVLDLGHPSIRKLGRLALPIIGYAAIAQVGLWVTNLIAWTYTGGVTGFQYAWQFFQLPIGVFAVSIITAVFPELSEQMASGDLASFKRIVSVGIRSLGIIMIPISALFALFSKQIIQVALQYGLFDAAATAITSKMLLYLSCSAYFCSVYLFLVRTFYSMQDTATPVKVIAVGVPINIVANLIAVKFLGVSGLGLAQAITFLFNSSLILYLLRRRVGALGARHILASTSKYVAAAIPMLMVSYAAFSVISHRWWEADFGVGKSAKMLESLSKAGQLGAAIGLGLVAYVTAIYMLKVEEVSALKKFGRRLVSLVRP